jgi:putative acetyltransferase
MQVQYQNFVVRPWQTGDRQSVAEVIGSVLAEYGLAWEPTGADRDVLAVEEYYQSRGGEFWVVEQGEKLVGTGAYYPIARGKKAAEIRKMYLLPEARGLGLGQFLLQHLEATIAAQNFAEIWIETASILTEAVRLYEGSGYQPASGVETTRCDRVYVKFLKSVI